jgi:GT2 family glycosyltransferase/glycosyltransferase involved in cell wall biosynthesis
MSNLKKANEVFRDGDYSSALKIYRDLIRENPSLERLLRQNIRLAEKKLQDESDELNTNPFDIIRANPSLIKKRQKVLVLDFRYPRFDASAGELATFGIIRILLQLGFDITFIPKESTNHDQRYIKVLERIGTRCVEDVTYDNFKEKVSKEVQGALFAYIFRPDVALQSTSAIRAASPDTIILYHAPDVYFRREYAQLDIEESKAENLDEKKSRLSKLVLEEVEAASSADHVVCVSEEDACALDQAMTQHLSPNNQSPLPEFSIFPVLYLQRVGHLPKFSQTKDICFVGSSEHLPNPDAIRWFLKNVWRYLIERNPSISLHIIGKTSEDEANYYRTYHNVVVVGWVSSIESHISKYRVSIAPLRFGAGIKGKVGTSLIAGVPCVASKVAVESMNLVTDREIVVADSAEEYVEKISSILDNEDEWTRLSRNGASKADQLYSHESTLRKLLQILHFNNVLNNHHYMEFIRSAATSSQLIDFSVFHGEELPEISIIIPGFNNAELTKRCLTSVYYSIRQASNKRAEFIYSDDGSEESVIDILEHKFKGVTFVQRKTNEGFVKNANTGASRAKGKFLIFLNNDTVVLPGWLEELMKVIESSESCAVAGSKLLYSDGSIQEIGAGLWTDGRSCSFGRGQIDGNDNINTLSLNIIQEVDYVSFASVAIRKKYWDLCNGLDENFGLGYFDDSDFCMKVRFHGGLVLTAPESEVLHIESSTFSQRLRKVVDSQKKLNSNYFRGKWANELLLHHPYYEYQDYDPGYMEARCRAHANRTRLGLQSENLNEDKNTRSILYYSPFPSHPASHGNQTTIQKFGKFLQAEGHSVHFALLKSHMYSSQDAHDMESAWNSFHLIDVDRFPGCNGNDIPYDNWYVNGIGEQIASLCHKLNIDVVICSYIFQSKLLDYVPSYILKIIDTHDKFTNRYSILDALGKEREFFSCSREEEGAYLSRADVVLARRDEEARYFDSISTAKIFTVPHFEDFNFLEKGINELKVVGIIASCNLINLDIVLSFVDELIRQRPTDWGFRVIIAGEVKTLIDTRNLNHARVYSHPHVSFVGFVENINDFYSSVDLIVCPIMSGTGINVKTVQALAYGMPVLATKHASKGIDTSHPYHQFESVENLVTALLKNTYRASDLHELASASKDIYIKFLNRGMQNFRDALRTDNSKRLPNLRKTLQTNLSSLTARKAKLISDGIQRRRILSRDSQINELIKSVVDFGPNWIRPADGWPNIQRDGGIGIWFRHNMIIRVDANLSLRVNDFSSRLHRSDDGLFMSTSIPTSVFEKQGTYDLYVHAKFPWERSEQGICMKISSIIIAG